MTQEIRILLIDEHQLFRAGIKALLQEQSSFIVEEAQDFQDAVHQVMHFRPNVILLDIECPFVKDFKEVAQLRANDPSLNIVLLTVRGDRETMTECLRLGAQGYLTKDIDPDYLVNAIRLVCRGGMVISPKMIEAASREPEVAVTQIEVPETLLTFRLTERERQLLSLLANGISNKEIAKGLNISANTVKSHIHRCMVKLDIYSRTKLAMFAREHFAANSTFQVCKR